MTNSTAARVCAVGLVLGPFMFTVGDLLRRMVEPSGTTSAAAITDAVGRHGGAWLAAALLSTAAAFCLVPAMVGVVAAARGRGARVTTVGAFLVGAGAVASVGHAVAFYTPYALYDRAGTAASEREAFDRASEAYPLLIALIVIFIVGMMLGSIVLLVGLRRARRVPIWSLVAAVVFVACGSTSGVGAGVVAIVAALAAFVPAARSLTTPSAEPAGAAASAAVRAEV